MKKILPLLCLPFFISCKKESSTNNPPVTVDSAFVTVTNGYGSGKYKTGDTVHIFSTAYNSSQLFDTWSGTDLSLLNGKDEWHTWFKMPARNVSFTGAVKNSVAFTLNLEQIRGRDRLKPVYSYFPAGHKGFVFLLHGTGGTALQFSNNYESQLLIRDLVHDHFGVIITEAEEATTGIDTNGDGALRWVPIPFDSSANVDFANIKIITDTFYNRGITNRSRLRYSIGMSNGGFFSGTLSMMYNYKAGISYCAPGGTAV